MPLLNYTHNRTKDSMMLGSQWRILGKLEELALQLVITTPVVIANLMEWFTQGNDNQCEALVVQLKGTIE
jgi:hypothetical protein